MKKGSIILFFVALGLLTTVIYFSGKNTSEGHIEFSSETKAPGQSDWDYNIGLTIEDLLKVDSIATFMAEVYPKEEALDSMIWLQKAAKAWDSLGHGLMSGYYHEKLAAKTNDPKDWYTAGKLFFNLQNSTSDTVIRQELASHAISSLEKTVSLDPGNLDAKAELGVSYMERPNNPPMQGIGLLREVLQVNPDHNGALYYLASLSIKSGQFDKAVERLSRLIELNPDNAFYYRYLALTYLELDDKANAISSFENYLERETDEAARAEALKLIEQLKN